MRAVFVEDLFNDVRGRRGGRGTGWKAKTRPRQADEVLDPAHEVENLIREVFTLVTEVSNLANECFKLANEGFSVTDEVWNLVGTLGTSWTKEKPWRTRFGSSLTRFKTSCMRF